MPSDGSHRSDGMKLLCNCSYGAYGCLESLLLSIAAVAILWVQIRGLLLILKDKNKVLGDSDKSVYILAIFQVILTLAFFLFLPTNFALFTTRAVRQFNEVNIAVIFLQSLVTNELFLRMYKFVYGVYLAIVAVWFYTGIWHSYGFQYACTNGDYLLSSSLGAVLVLANIYLQIRVYAQMHQIYLEQCNNRRSTDGSDQQAPVEDDSLS